MAERFAKSLVAVALVAGLWALGTARRTAGESWVRSAGTAPGPVHILQFYSTVGSLKAGEKAMLCYAVENAKWVRIAPLLEGTFPSTNRCLEVVPLHTTHYTILAEGFDGHVAMQSLTLPVEVMPAPAPQPRNFARKLDGGARTNYSAFFCNSSRSAKTSWLCGLGLTFV